MEQKQSSRLGGLKNAIRSENAIEHVLIGANHNVDERRLVGDIGRARRAAVSERGRRTQRRCGSVVANNVLFTSELEPLQ